MNKTTLAALLVAPVLLASCIAAEEENTECDIEAVSLHLDSPVDVFYHEYDTLKTIISTETAIVFTCRSYASVHSIPVTLRTTAGSSVYELTDGQTLTPFVNGSALDFSDEQVHRFRIISEDKAWSRDYSISVVHDAPSEGNLFIDFEKYELDASGKYYVWEAPNVFTDSQWKNGNPGFKISKSSAQPMDYPDTPVAGGGPDGSDCIKLETCDTGPFGRMVNMMIASGSLFNGVFDVGNALFADPDNMAAGPSSYGMTDTMGRMHSDAQFAGSSSVPAHVEMMGLIGMGNNPMVGATVACAVAVEEAAK